MLSNTVVAAVMIRWSARSQKVDAELVDMSLSHNECVSQCGLAHRGPVTRLVVEAASSQQLLVTAGRDHLVKVWSLMNSQLLCTLTGHSHSVCLSVCLSVCVHMFLYVSSACMTLPSVCHLYAWICHCLFFHSLSLPLSSLSLLFHAGQAAIKLPSAEASKRAQCTSPGQYAPYIKGIMKTP